MKRHLHSSGGILAVIALLLIGGCGKKTFQSSEPAPTLEITALQDSYAIDRAAYLQIDVAQQGYEGGYLLSAVLQEGGCSLSMQGSEVPTSGEWIPLAGTSEILTLVPTLAGPLRISFEVKAEGGEQSGRSFVHFTVTESPELGLEIDAPATSSGLSPAEITLRLTKAGWNGTIPEKFDLTDGSGALQYGAVTVGSGDRIAIPANVEQILYYIPDERGIHKLQFSATDGYTTQYANAEIIVTQ